MLPISNPYRMMVLSAAPPLKYSKSLRTCSLQDFNIATLILPFITCIQGCFPTSNKRLLVRFRSPRLLYLQSSTLLSFQKANRLIFKALSEPFQWLNLLAFLKQPGEGYFPFVPGKRRMKGTPSTPDNGAK